MNVLIRNKRRFYGPPQQLLNSSCWNPALHPRNSIGEFIYTDGGLHGRSSSPSGAPNKISKKWPQAIPYRAGYRRNPNNPHFIKTDEIPPNSQKFTAPNGETFLAPAGTNFQDVYDAGKTQGWLGARHNVWQYRIYDFQRNGGGGPKPGNLDNIFYSAYTDASNYAAGVYMNGAGASLSETLNSARIEALVTRSKNAGSPRQREWQTQGWQAAEAQKSGWDKTK
jgi:hypothetical protein